MDIEARMARLREQGRTLKAIAAELDVPLGRVNRWRKKVNSKDTSKRPIHTKEEAQIAKLQEQIRELQLKNRESEGQVVLVSEHRRVVDKYANAMVGALQRMPAAFKAARPDCLPEDVAVIRSLAEDAVRDVLEAK